MQNKYMLSLLALLLISCGQSSDPKTEAAGLASQASQAFQSENYALAVQQFLRATDLRPEVPEYWTGLGMAQAAQEKSEGATISYEKALSLLRAEDQQRFGDQAFLLLLLGRKDEAAQAIAEHNKDADQALEISNLTGEETERFRIK